MTCCVQPRFTSLGDAADKLCPDLVAPMTEGLPPLLEDRDFGKCFAFGALTKHVDAVPEKESGWKPRSSSNSWRRMRSQANE